jgi:hypothetical protein
VVFALVGLLAGLLLIGVVAVVVFGYFLATRSKQEYDRSNVTVPGRSANVPSSWGGSHDPEALLHRRIVAAMDALRANQAFDDDGALLDLRVELETQATGLDQQLIATAALPASAKAEPLAKASDAVGHLEAAVAQLATQAAGASLDSLRAAVDAVRERTTLMGQAQQSFPSTPAMFGPPTPDMLAVPPAPVPTPEPAPVEAPPMAEAPQTSPPQTSPPQTSPPQTSPPQTDPPQTSPPQTDPPQTSPPSPEG